MVSHLERQWYAGGPLPRLLAPLGGLYCGAMRLRRALYRRCWLRPHPNPVPVVVVGNLTVGGTGKTPLVIAITDWLRAAGRRPAVVSRGYGRSGKGVAVVSQGAESRMTAGEAGDEPAMLAARLAVPVVVGGDRSAAVVRAAELGADCVVADDGFQRLSLARERGFVVVDGRRGFGNGRCLPAGPLREPLSALADADAVVAAGAPLQEPVDQTVGVGGRQPDIRMTLKPDGLRRTSGGDQETGLAWLRGRRVHAVAGIGDAERFFATLRRLGAEVIPHAFPDHHAYGPGDLRFPGDAPLVTTDKDAVKLARLGIDGWALRVSARLDPQPDGWLADLPPAGTGGVSFTE